VTHRCYRSAQADHGGLASCTHRNRAT
jgi:hypothetical protein